MDPEDQEVPRSREELIELVLEHAEYPLNGGPIDDPTVMRKGGNPGCGDEVVVYLRVGEGDRVVAVGHEGTGCHISRAANSIASDLVDALTLDEIEALAPDAVIRVLGRELAMTRPRCAVMGLNTFRAAVRDVRAARLRRDGAEASEHAVE